VANHVDDASEWWSGWCRDFPWVSHGEQRKLLHQGAIEDGPHVEISSTLLARWNLAW
jgi:hypothetical protein